MPSPLGRFTFTEGTSNKFWECLEAENGTYLTRWGRIGTKGQSKPGLSAGQAQTKISEKLREGYTHEYDSAKSVAEDLDRKLPKAPLVAPARRRM